MSVSGTRFTKGRGHFQVLTGMNDGRRATISLYHRSSVAGHCRSLRRGHSPGSNVMGPHLAGVGTQRGCRAPVLRTNMANTSPEHNTARKLVLDGKQFTAIPNWVFDIAMRVIPAEALQVLLHCMRKTIGWADSPGSFGSGIRTFQEDTGLSTDTISKWLWTFSYIGFIYYSPAKNGARETRILMFPHGLPTREQVHAAFSGIASSCKEASGQRLAAREFALKVRRHALYWRLQNMRHEEHQAFRSRIDLEKQTLI